MEYDTQGFVNAEDGTRLFYGEVGPTQTDSPELTPVVLCDGIGCDGFVWRYLQPHLAENRRVIHWHYRGHGRSGAPPSADSMTIETLAADLDVVLKHLEVPKVVVVGHSMGTLVALEWEMITQRHHDEARCAGALLLCGSAGRITHTFRGSDALNDLLPGLIDLVNRNRGLVRAVWGRVPPSFAYRLAKLSGDVDPAQLRSEDFSRYWNHVSDMDPDVFLRMLSAAGDYSAHDALPRLKAPKLVVAAENDSFTPAEYVTALAEELPDAELFCIRGGSHAAPVEQPMAVQLRVDKFLRDRAL